MAQRFKAKTLISNSGVFNNEVTAPNLVYNTGNQIISGNLAISGNLENSSILSVQRISGINNFYGGSLFIQGVNDQTVLMNPVGVTYPGGISINAGTGIDNGTGKKGKIELLGNIDINFVSPFLAGDNLKNSREFAQRKINIWKTGITNDGILRGYSGITIDNENIYLNTPVDGATGFGLIISGVQVTPNLYVNTTSNQTISGVKTFATGVIMSDNLQVSGTGIFNAIDLNNIDNLSLSGVDITITSGVVSLTNPLSAPNLVYNTGNQIISGIKTFVQTGSFDTVQITNKKLSSYSYNSTNFIFGDNYVNLTNSSTNITGTLPSGITSGINYYVKNLNTGILLITGSGQRTIDGFSSINLYRNESLQLIGVNNVGYTGWVTLSADNGVS